MDERKMYLLLDSWNKPLAKGVMKSPPQSELLQVQVLDGQVDAVVGHELVQLLGTGSEERALKCRLVRNRNDMVVLEPLEIVDTLLRKNLRIPVCFDSFLYPAGGGRVPIRSVDLSCGGIAFYAEQRLDENGQMEIVIPCTGPPLIVQSRVLRMNELNDGRILYAAKFVDLCHDEEKLIRSAVFTIQITNERS